MTKYEDWQKYVKEQMEQSDKNKSDSTPVSPRRNVPSINGDRFRIQRRTPPSEPGEGTKEKPEEQAHTGAGTHNAHARRPSSPLTSPFVSVSDVWEEAERSSKIRQSTKEESRRLQQKRLPGIERISQPDAPESAAPAKGRSSQGKTREEILERLVNPTITLEEAAKIMGVCKATVRRYTARGVLPHYRTPGNQRRFKLNDIITFLENQRK